MPIPHYTLIVISQIKIPDPSSDTGMTTLHTLQGAGISLKKSRTTPPGCVVIPSHLFAHYERMKAVINEWDRGPSVITDGMVLSQFILLLQVY